MPCEDCLNRREFLAKSAAGAAAIVALGACGDGQFGPPERDDIGGRVTYDIRNFPGLATVGILVDISTNVTPDRAAIRTSTSTFLAFSKLCTHQQCSTDVRSNEFVCRVTGRGSGTTARSSTARISQARRSPRSPDCR